MGEEEVVTEAFEVVENGIVPLEKDGESVTEKNEEVRDGAEEMEEDCKDEENVETTKVNVDNSEANEINEVKAKEETELKENNEEEKDKGKEELEHNSEEMDEENVNEEEEEHKSEAMDEKNVNEESEDKVENAAGLKVAEKKVSKKRGKAKIAGDKVNNKKNSAEEKNEKEQKSPVTPAIERPVRERKSVERLVATIERDTVKELHIEKGRGTALKDIPNVAYKLSKKKTDETCRLLHTILYGRRGKAPQVKTNISRFSGFVWHKNEDKQKIKVQEKFDKCVKEKLLEFCDVLDLPITKATTRKEDIVTKLIDFLVAPHATTTELLAEKEQSSKGKKRKQPSKNSSLTSGCTPSRSSLKSRKKIKNASTEEDKKNKTDPEEEHVEEQEDGDEDEHKEQENVNGVPERFEDMKLEHTKSEEKETESEAESEEDTRKHKEGLKKSSARKNLSEKAKTKKIVTPKKLSSLPKKAHLKSFSSRSKVEENNDTSPKMFSRKKKKEIVNKKSTPPKKNVLKEKTGEKAVKGKENPKVEKLRPSNNELKNAICEILKEVDFNTATFTDILKLLAKRFNTDLTPRKSSIKLMIQDELTKLADEAEDEEEGDNVRDEKQVSNPGVNA